MEQPVTMIPALTILAVLTVPALGRTLGGMQPFIVNGKDVDVVGKYPYQASYQRYGDHYCGAAIISAKYLLTVAHCCSPASRPFNIVVGAHDIKTKDEGKPTTYSILSKLRHPGFGEGTGTLENDVCIITLSEDIDMTNPYVGKIDLPAVGSTEDFVGSDCIMTGWGHTQIGSTGKPNVLQEAHTTPITFAACKVAVEKIPLLEGVVVVSNICAGGVGSDKPGGCHGDSGSPLVCPSSAGGKVLAGLTSWGALDCDPQHPTMYTRITSFREWIKENTGI